MGACTQSKTSLDFINEKKNGFKKEKKKRYLQSSEEKKYFSLTRLLQSTSSETHG